ncbi:DNA binding domain-containing protein, excisionase family [Actinomadura meyerae]|uniref:DNA binding domain-containing protein, excisionase family n=1 Tax=Actinomadura meyerae TaxID=240840 RepID=A0A239MQ29_9ACTN|nr:helix-turn-helix domain-containing protein [Actinomadura meyerae]SNT44068.1 DNA binding domain-containing protein, excisionase family [Actinomadura meyerae]
MDDKLYSVDEVADLLGLHARTVRRYIREGRLKAVRIGKQYRIGRRDLEELTGDPEPGGRSGVQVEVSSIVQVDGVDRHMADRLGTFVVSAAQSGPAPGRPVHIQVVHDEEGQRMKIVLLGGAAATAEVLRLIDALLGEGGGLGQGGGLGGGGGLGQEAGDE